MKNHLLVHVESEDMEGLLIGCNSTIHWLEQGEKERKAEEPSGKSRYFFTNKDKPFFNFASEEDFIAKEQSLKNLEKELKIKEEALNKRESEINEKAGNLAAKTVILETKENYLSEKETKVIKREEEIAPPTPKKKPRSYY